MSVICEYFTVEISNGFYFGLLAIFVSNLVFSACGLCELQYYIYVIYFSFLLLREAFPYSYSWFDFRVEIRGIEKGTVHRWADFVCCFDKY